MSAGDRPHESTIERMRAEFDRAFASPAAPPARNRAQLLGIRVGGDPFALPLGGVLAIHVDRKIVPVPSASPTVIGIASFRGALAPVHDLRLLLGYPARTPTRWLVLVAGATPLGLAFDAFEGQIAAATTQAVQGSFSRPPAAGGRSRSAELTRGLIQTGDTIRPLLDLGALLAAAGSGPAISPQTQER